MIDWERRRWNKELERLLLVSDDAQVDGGISVLLDGGQQSGAVGVSDFSRVEVVLWVQQLRASAHTHHNII